MNQGRRIVLDRCGSFLTTPYGLNKSAPPSLHQTVRVVSNDPRECRHAPRQSVFSLARKCLATTTLPPAQTTIKSTPGTKEIIEASVQSQRQPDKAMGTTEITHEPLAAKAMACQRYWDHRLLRKRPSAVTSIAAERSSQKNESEETAHHPTYADHISKNPASSLTIMTLRSNTLAHQTGTTKRGQIYFSIPLVNPKFPQIPNTASDWFMV